MASTTIGTKIVDNNIKTNEIPSIPTAKLILNDEIQELLCTYCILVEALSNPVASNIESAATIKVTPNANLFINSIFLLGTTARKIAPINGNTPIAVNKLMRSPTKLPLSAQVPLLPSSMHNFLHSHFVES